jgi:SAM-dependent methyltransferase
MDLLEHVDLTGLACIDIGAGDGLIAFNMKARGAELVVATEEAPRGRESFLVARELLNSDVELFADTTFGNVVDKVGEHVLDVAVCAGVFYHMLNPFDSILKARRLLKRNGLFLFQTRYHPGESRPALDFNPVSQRVDAPNVYWVPTKAAVTGMLALSGFQVLAIRTGTQHEFLTVLACNVTTDEINDNRGRIRYQLRSGITSAEYLAELPEESSKAFYRGKQDERTIEDIEYEPDFPPHPKAVLGTLVP